MSGDNWVYSHGSLAFLLSLYIFGQYWLSKIDDLKFRFDIFGIFFLVGSVVVWLIGELGSVLVVQQFSVIWMVGFIFWGLFGFTVFIKLLIPVFIMLTTIPLWDFLDIYLQHITTAGVSAMLSVTTIPFIKEGFEIQLHSGTFKVEDVCSGLRMLTAITPVALFYLHLNNIRWQMGIIYVGLALFAAILANVIRIFIVVVAGHLTDMKHYFVTTDHITLGWVVFGIVVFVFIYLSNRILLSTKVYPFVVSRSKIKDASTVIRPQFQPTKYFIATVCLFALLVAGGPLMAEVFSYTEKLDKTIELSPKYGDWRKVNGKSSVLRPSYQGNDFEANSIYQRKTGELAQIYIAVYKEQKQGKEAVHYLNKPYDSKIFQLVNKTQRNIKSNNIGELPVTEYIVRSSTGRQKLVWEWYYSGGVKTNNELLAKVLGVKAKLSGNPIFSVIVFATDVQLGHQTASNRLRELVDQSFIGLEVGLDSLS